MGIESPRLEPLMLLLLRETRRWFGARQRVGVSESLLRRTRRGGGGLVWTRQNVVEVVEIVVEAVVVEIVVI
jgi:hypothetical protein